MRWWISNLGQWSLWNVGSVAMLNTLFYSCPIFISRFWIVIGYLFRPTTPKSVTVLCSRTSMSHPLCTSSPGAVRRQPVCRPHPPHTSFHHSSLRLAPHAFAYCCSRVRSPPCWISRPALRSLSGPLGSLVTGPSVYLSPCLSLPFCDPLPGIFWFLVSVCECIVWARARSQGASTPWQSLAPVLSPTILGHTGAIRISRPSPPPPLSLYPFSS